MKNKRTRRLIAMMLAVILAIGVAYQYMPDVKAENNTEFVQKFVDTGSVSPEWFTWAVDTVDYNAGKITTAGIQSNNSAYAVAGFEYDSEVWNACTPAAVSLNAVEGTICRVKKEDVDYFKPVNGGGIVLTSQAVAENDKKIKVLYKLTEEALDNVSLYKITDGQLEDYTEGDWTNTDVVMRIEVNAGVSGASVSVTNESGVESLVPELDNNVATCTVSAVEGGTIQNTYQIALTDAEESTPYCISKTIKIDKALPVIGSYTINPDKKDSVSAQADKEDKYSFFYKEDTDVNVNVSDAGSGVKKVTYSLQTADNTYFVDNGTTYKDCSVSLNDNNNIAKITIPAGFKGRLIVKVEDKAGNSVESSPSGFVIESEEQHEAAIADGTVTASAVIASTNNIAGVIPELFANDVELTLKAKDAISGIGKISWKIVDGSDVVTSGSVATADFAGLMGTKDKGIYTEVSKTIRVDKDVKNAHAELTFEDNAGNTTTVVSETFSIDKTNPGKGDVTLTAPVYKDSGNKKYYNASDEGKFYFTVKDENSGIVKAAVSLYKGNVQVGSVAEVAYSAVTDETSTSKQLSDFGITSMSEGKYQIKVVAYDRAGNSSEYTSEEFCVDTVKPECISYTVEKTATTADKILNILTFGIYSNDGVKVTVTAEDKTGAINTGIRNITVTNLADNAEIVSRNYSHNDYQGTTTCTFELNEFDEKGLYQLQVTATDKVGNVSDSKKLSDIECTSAQNAKLTENELILEKTKPVIDKLDTSGYAYLNGSDEWYAAFDDINVQIDVADKGTNTSGLDYVKVFADENELSWSAAYENAKVNTYAVNNQALSSVYGYSNVNGDGSVRLRAEAQDNAGNKADTRTKTVYVDQNTPYVTQFEFMASSDAKEGSELPVERTEYGFFFQTPTKVVIHTADDAPSSGIDSVVFRMVDENGSIVKEESLPVNADNCAGFTVDAGFKGQIQARVIDNTGHGSVYVNPDGVVTETQEQHEADAVTVIGRPATQKKSVNGQDLYNEDTNLSFTVQDHISGIDTIEWSVISDGVTTQSGITKIDINGEKTGDVDWSGNGQGEDRNLVTELSKEIRIPESADVIKVQLKMTDRSGYVTADTTTFSIDKDLPEVTELKLTKPGYTDNSDKKYYIPSDKVEFSFEADDVTGSCVDTALSIGSGLSYAETVIEKKSGTSWTKKGSWSNSYNMLVTTEALSVRDILNAETLEEGEYRIRVTVKDNAGNVGKTAECMFYVDAAKPECISYTVEKTATTADKILNILTFGIYSNDSVKVTVTAEDKSGAINTGIRNITVTNLANKKEIISQNYSHNNYQGTTTCTFELKEFDENGLYQLQVTATDKVGNVSDSKKLSEMVCTTKQNHKISSENELILEKTKPVIDTLKTSGYAYMNGSDEWYAAFSDINVSIDAADKGKNISGLNNVKIYADENELGWSAGYENKKTASYTVKDQYLSTVYAYSNVNGDGSVRLKAEAMDNAGNKADTKTKTVYVDQDTPYVTQFEFLASSEAKEGSETPVQRTYYGFFFQTAVNVVVHTKDDGPSSGIDYVTFQMVDENGNVVKTESQYVNNDCAMFTVDAGFKGQIYAKVIDHVRHESGYVNPDGVVAETLQQHEADAYVSITRPQTAMQAVNGLELYNNDTDMTFTVKDHISGIDTIEWSVYADGTMTQTGTAKIDTNGMISGDGGWSGSMNTNLVTELSKGIRVTDNASVITVYLKMTDRSGYEKYTETTFSIDKTAPQIAITYDNNSPDASNPEYFKEVRHATVVVTERNFDPSRISISITNSDGVMPVISGWSEAVGRMANGDDTTHTCVISYEADGDYLFDISMTDRAGYVNVPVDYANSAAPQKFTIDRTLPVMKITYDTSALQNGNYSQTERTATITVQEHNFNPADFVLTSRATDGADAVAFPNISSFGGNGDVHTATIHFASDAEYVYSIAYTDMAGNAAESLPEEDFFVDLKKPDVKVMNGSDVISDTTGNVDNRIGVFTKGSQISPVVEVQDRNYNAASTTVSLSKRNGENIEYSVADITNASGNGSRYSFRAIEDTYEQDGAYTLTYKVQDKAGNETTQVWDFKVNRHGTQLDSAEIKSLNNAIYNGSGMIINGKNKQKYVLTLTCAQKLQSIRILLGNIELKESQYKLSDPVELENGMFEYKLELLDSAFARDGDYHLAIYTLVEGAQEEQELLSYWGEDLMIIVDSTNPQQRIRDLKDDETYDMSEKTFDIVVDDPHLETLVVTLNGKSEQIAVEDLEKTGETEYTLAYTVKARNSTEKQTLAVEGKDIAGNTTKKFAIEGKNGEQTLEVASFMVTTSGWIIFMENVKQNIVWIITIILIIVLAATGVVWMKKKKSSKAKEA